jgi:hypothetical protein
MHSSIVADGTVGLPEDAAMAVTSSMTWMRWTFPLTAAAAVLAVTAGAAGQTPPAGFEIPKNATALEGLPRVRIDATQDGATRQVLDPAEAARNRLTIRIADGRLYWAGHDDRPLSVGSSGGFVYLSSTVPGRYVRFRQLNDRLTYVEHVDMAFGSVTYWGELRIVLAK